MSAHQIRLFSTPPHHCSYLAEEVAVNAILDPGIRLSSELYSYMIDHGFRRSGDHIYAPHCPSCSACWPSRIPTDTFKPNRSQRRCLNKNSDLQTKVIPAHYTDEYFDLYHRYLLDRHKNGGMANTSPEKFKDFLISNWCDTIFIEFRLKGELVSIAVCDVLKQGYSAVYTFFDTSKANRSLGVFSILWQIKHAKSQGLPFVYLGYLIEECDKMRYKRNYQPLELLRDGEWQTKKL